jgi:hypothetical protein
MKYIEYCVVATLVFIPAIAVGQMGIPQGDKVLEALVEEQKRCPMDRECTTIDTFVRGSNKGEVKKYPLGALTAEKGFDRVVILQEITGEYGVIVNTVKVGQPGKWTAHTQGVRLPEGRTELTAPIPAGTPEIQISFDHGRGAKVEVVLERPRP